MHALHTYLCSELEKRVRQHKVVVFYDPRSEFGPFVESELQEIGTGYDGLSRFWLGDKETFVVPTEGSFFALRSKVEPIMSSEDPAPLVIYVPGEEPKREHSVLLEMELAGDRYEPRLRQVARYLLRKQLSDGKIDELLANDGFGYADIVAVLRQAGEGGGASVLKAVLGESKASEDLIADWVRDAGRDAELVDKGAQAELLQLLEARIGWADAGELPLPQWRDRVARYLLVNEFRSDLGCDAPSSLQLVPGHKNQDQLGRIRMINQRLRREHPSDYEALADRIEQELHLSAADVDASSLGSIDTFRFEEAALLAVAGKKIIEEDWTAAAEIVDARRSSFWLDRRIDRQSQWQVCRYLVELGEAVGAIGAEVVSAKGDPAKWVESYCDEDGWHRVDLIQRRLETHIATMDAEPELEQALQVVRRAHESLMHTMATGFTGAMASSDWAVAGVLRQPDIYPKVVDQGGGLTAYFFVDAMRYEMGVELSHQLDAGEELRLRPAIGVLPSITTVGMAALLPGAAESFSVVTDGNKLASQIGDKKMPGVQQRMSHLKAVVPGSLDILLGRVLEDGEASLRKKVEGASLVVVRSQEIDAAGENVDGLAARQAMQSVISNIARAVRKLARCGVERFVITADHGHLFSLRKEDDMKVDGPGGDTVELHRRCWIGRGGSTPPGATRLKGGDLGYNTDLEFVFPGGNGVFKSGGGLSFHHGGVSLQEMVIPVLTLRMAAPSSADGGGLTVKLLDAPGELTNRAFSCKLHVGAALFAEGGAELLVQVWSGKTPVGECMMAHDAELDPDKKTVRIRPGTTASLGLLVTGDPGDSVQIKVLDASSDAVLAESAKMPVNLNI